MRTLIRQFFVVLSTSLLIVHSAAAGDAGRETPFSLGAGARSLAMGGGFTSLASDATAMYYNPAGLGYLEYPEAAFMHSILFEGTIYNFAAWAYPISERNGVGVAYMRIGTDDIIRRDNYTDRGMFNYSHSQFVLSYGSNFGQFIGIGMSLKIVNQAMDDLSDFGAGLDIGLRSRIYRQLSIGLIARDIIPAELELASVIERTPWSLMGGVSLEGLSISEKTSVSLAFDLEKHEDRSSKVHAGAELKFHNTFSLRAGYDRDNFAFGAGLLHGPVRVDYAYKLHDFMDDVHHFSLSFLLGESVSSRNVRVQQVPQTVTPLTAEEIELKRLKDTANYFFRRFDLDSALVYFRQVNSLDSTDAEVADIIPSIEQALRVQVEQEGRLRTAERDLQLYMQNFYSQARLFFDRGNYSAALDLLELIFDANPHNAQAIQLREMIQEAITTEIAAKTELARTAEEDGQIVQAIEAYNRILDLDQDNQEIIDARRRALDRLDWAQQLSLGISHYEAGRLTEATRRFNAVLRMKPNEAVALEYLQKIQSQPVGTRPAELEDLQKDSRIWQHYLDGLRYMRNGEYQKAIDEWEMILEVYPNNPNTLNNIEQAKLRLETE